MVAMRPRILMPKVVPATGLHRVSTDNSLDKCTINKDHRHQEVIMEIIDAGEDQVAGFLQGWRPR